MQFTLEELEDLLIVGESTAIKDDKEFSVEIPLKEFEMDNDPNEDEPMGRTGFKLSFRPEPIEKTVGVSQVLYEEAELEAMFRTFKKDGVTEDWTFQTSIQELMEENRNFKELEFSHVNFNGKTYTDKNKFLEEFGINTLAIVSFKIPPTILTKFKKICSRKYGSVSDRIRTLIENDLENEIKMAVRKEIFK